MELLPSREFGAERGSVAGLDIDDLERIGRDESKHAFHLHLLHDDATIAGIGGIMWG
jgi:hypothetical protein